MLGCFYKESNKINFKNNNKLEMEECCGNSTADGKEVLDVPFNPLLDAERFVVATLLAIAGILGISGNSLVIVAVMLFKKLRSSTNVFVVNLCVADWITCFNMPWTIIGVVNPDNQWPLPDWICVLCGFNLITCIGCSTCTLALIAINRYVIITSHAKLYPLLFTRRNMFFMVLFAWLFPLSLATVPLVSNFGDLGYDYMYRSCTWDTKNPYSEIYSMLLGGAFTPIQFTIIVVCYIKIFLYIKAHLKRLHPGSFDNTSHHPPSNLNEVPTTDAARNDATTTPGTDTLRSSLTKRQVKVTKNMFYVVCGFMVCMLDAIWTKYDIAN